MYSDASRDRLYLISSMCNRHADISPCTSLPYFESLEHSFGSDGDLSIIFSAGRVGPAISISLRSSFKSSERRRVSPSGHEKLHG